MTDVLGTFAAANVEVLVIWTRPILARKGGVVQYRGCVEREIALPKYFD